MRKLLLLPLVLLASIAFADDGVPSGEPDDVAVAVALDAVPAVVMDSARSAKPDVFFTGAEYYWEDDLLVYRLVGSQFSQEWEVYVEAGGRVLDVASDYRGS